jgi:alkylated DNA repair dioxygenase AlkB
MQTSLFEPKPEQNAFVQLPMQDANVRYFPNWLEQLKAHQYLNILSNTLRWRQDTIKLYGKEHFIPRLQAWYGDDDAFYKYSGLPLAPLEWTPALIELKQCCEGIAGQRFNSVLANWYRDGRDSMGMHSDDEPELGQRPTIASVSLGAERQLIFKHKQTKQRVPVPLANGSLLIMSDQTQDYWQHGINKTAKPIDARINLTFRRIQHENSTADQ